MKDPCEGCLTGNIKTINGGKIKDCIDGCQTVCLGRAEYQGYLIGLAEGEVKGKAEERERIAKWLEECVYQECYGYIQLNIPKEDWQQLAAELKQEG